MDCQRCGQGIAAGDGREPTLIGTMHSDCAPVGVIKLSVTEDGWDFTEKGKTAYGMAAFAAPNTEELIPRWVLDAYKADVLGTGRIATYLVYEDDGGTGCIVKCYTHKGFEFERYVNIGATGGTQKSSSTV